MLVSCPLTQPGHINWWRGKIIEFDASKEDWKNFVEKLIIFFATNDVTDNNKKRAVLLSSCGSAPYKMFRSLSQPSNPGEKCYTELVQLMEANQNPKPNPVAEWFKFNSQNRLPGDTITTYIAELRQLTEHCNSGTTLQEMLRYILVRGIRHDRIQQALLSEGEGLTS